jgi:hypothetical protein
MHLTGSKKKKGKLKTTRFRRWLNQFPINFFLRHNLQNKTCANNNGDANVDPSLAHDAKILEQSFQRRSII